MQTRLSLPALLALLAVVALAIAPTGLAAAPVNSSTLESIIESIVPADDVVGEAKRRGPAEVAAPS